MKFNFAGALLLLLLIHGQQAVIWSKPEAPPPSCKSIECPIYDIIEESDSYEIRRYNHTVWMSTSSIRNISFVDATRTGFLRLFDYIQGQNEKHAKVPMTAPVLTEIFPSSGPFCESSFIVSFYVPASFQKSPPKAKKSLALEESRWGVRFAAVRRFGGFVSDYNVGEEAAKLQASLMGTRWETAIAKSKSDESSLYTVAQYNSPFEFESRVNEIWMPFSNPNLASNVKIRELRWYM
ncbi:hypothetical protein SUGI_0056530 [Cryptomeria japonica]|uniref:uncharacterized protein LOC131064799 n=1 Tax=Cryptomeria japonica TaxID=3369 RepID=UPI0024089EDC|nr:uncharacterized protein LOC131064799 [Cryptomeria japonica]GLJ07049.1 hypothetical protein SUGI_0056530 [Cryptomeria japonica]